MFRATAALALTFALAISAATPLSAEARQPKKVDISPVRKSLRIFHDGKRHYLIVPDIGSRDTWTSSLRKAIKNNIFYGNGKRFYRQLVSGVGRNPPRFWLSIVDPRARIMAYSSFSYKPGVAIFSCERRKTRLRELIGAERDRMLRKAKFLGRFWDRQAHLLARDDDGRYFYVDRKWVNRYARRDLRGVDFKGFRFWIGQRGRMKRVKLRNIVSDPAGQIFITPRGKLFVSGTWRRRKARWLGKKAQKKLPLTVVPINARNGGLVMIYQQLGPYVGLELKKPCDHW